MPMRKLGFCKGFVVNVAQSFQPKSYTVASVALASEDS